jgi:hypothetical protein
MVNASIDIVPLHHAISCLLRPEISWDTGSAMTRRAIKCLLSVLQPLLPLLVQRLEQGTRHVASFQITIVARSKRKRIIRSNMIIALAALAVSRFELCFGGIDRGWMVNGW